MPTKILTHSSYALRIAVRLGWKPGARYTNLRDVRQFERIWFLDIDWKSYKYDTHLKAVKETKPRLTVARDIEMIEDLPQILEEADELAEHAERVILVPKDPRLTEGMEELIPSQYHFGYSVPSRYGGTTIPPNHFIRPVHLLGGRPDQQRALANHLNVVSLDCNRFTIDARYGKYFDGERFVRHPVGGYARCLADSIANINRIWSGYLTQQA